MEQKVNLRAAWVNEGTAISGEAVRSQQAKGHKTGEWFRTASWKGHRLYLL